MHKAAQHLIGHYHAGQAYFYQAARVEDGDDPVLDLQPGIAASFVG